MKMVTLNGDGDPRYEALYRKFYGRVYRFFNPGRIGDDDAHDLAQETFLRIYERFGSYRGEAEWSFIETTARRVLLNRVRAQQTAKRHANLVDIDHPSAHAVPAAETPDLAERQELANRRALFLKAMGQLSKAQRDCLALWLEDRPYEEISVLLGISMDAVKSRLRDAKGRLRELVGEPVFPEDKQ